MNLKADVKKLVDDKELTLFYAIEKNCQIFGYNNKTLCVTFLNESPFVDGVLNMSVIREYMEILNNFTGAYAIIWDCDSLLRFINGHPPVGNSYLTRENIDLYAWEYF